MKIRTVISIIQNLPKTIYFNFHYLPFKQAMKLPIIFMSGIRLDEIKGSVEFSCLPKTGMVRIGSGHNSLYLQKNYQCVWANYGGKVIFGEKVYLSKGVAIEVGQHGNLIFGDNVIFGVLSRIACYKEVQIGQNSRFSWEIIVTDTDFHHTINATTGDKSVMCKTVRIGKNNWIGIRSFIMKGTQTPDYCTVSGYSVLNKKYDLPNYSIIGGIPAKLLKEGWYRDLNSHVNDLEQAKINKSN